MAIRTYTINGQVDAIKLDTSIKKVTTANTYKVKIEADGSSTSKLSQSIQNVTDSTGQATRTIQKFNTKTGELANTTQRVTNTVVNSSKSLKDMGSNFVDIIKKVTLFGSATAIIGMVTSSIGEAVKTIKDFDDAVTNFKKVSDLSGKGLNDYTANLGKLGETVARTRTEMVQNATIFKQAGYSDEDSATLARVGALYQNVADSEVSASDAGAFLVSQMKAWNLTADQAESVVSALNEVSNKYAVSNTDLAAGLTKSSSAMSSLGNTSSQTIGLITAGTEQLTGQAAKVGKGLQIIGINLSNMAKKSKTLGISVGGATKEIKLYNDTTGDILSTFDILKQVSQYWGDMSKAEQTAVGYTQAGKTRFDVYSAVMNRFGDAVSASETALLSAGSAEAENAKYMDSLSARINLLKQQFQELVLGDGGITSFAKIMVSVATEILKFTNSGIGQLLIKVSLLAGGIKLLTIAFGGLATLAKGNFVTSLVSIVAEIGAMITGASSLTNVMTALTISMEANPLFWGALAVTAVVAIVKVIQDISEREQKLTEIVDKQIKKINDLKSQYGELEKIGKSRALTEAEKARLGYLGAEIKSNKILLQQEYEKEAQARQTRIENEKYKNEENQKQLKAVKNNQVLSVSTDSRGRTNGMGTTTDQRAPIIRQQNLTSKSKQTNISEKDSILELAKAYKSLNSQTGLNSKQVQANTALQAKAIKNIITQAEKIQERKDAGVKLTETDKKLLHVAKDTITAYNKKNKVSADSAKATDLANQSEDELAESVKDADKAYTDAISSVNGMSDSFTTLNDAIDEYNSTGSMSFDTLNKFLSLSPEYLQVLDLENGKLSLNKDKAIELANAKIDEAESSAYEATLTKLASGAFDQYSSSADSSVGASSSSANATNFVVQGLSNVENQALRTTTAVNQYNSALEGSKTYKKADTESRKTAESSLKTQITVLEGLRGKIGKFTVATTTSTKAQKASTNANKSNTSARKANTDAIKTQEDALKNQKEVYDTVISYIKDKVNDYIKTLEDAKDKEVKGIEDRIDAIKKAEETEEKYWQDKIDALESQNDAIESQIELQTLLDNLERAKQTKKKVYHEGQGFVYESDLEGVSQAQKDLQDYYRKKQYDEQVKELEGFRDRAKNNYEQQITNLEAYEEQVKTSYDNQINYYKQWVEQFEDGINQYEQQQDRLKAIQLAGVDFEQQGWQSRLSNLSSFVSQYNSLLAQIANAQAQQQAVSASSGGGGSGGGGGYSAPSSKASSSKAYHVVQKIGNGSKKKSTASSHIGSYGGDSVFQDSDGKWYVYKRSQSIAKDFGSKAEAQNLLNIYNPRKREGFGIAYYAQGSYELTDDQIAMVGDNPNYRELLIGSKLNSANQGGVPINASKGTGIIPNNLTSSLVRLASSYNQGRLVNSSNNNQSINIENINLPSVKNGEDFVDYLQNFSSVMTQQVYQK